MGFQAFWGERPTELIGYDDKCRSRKTKGGFNIDYIGSEIIASNYWETQASREGWMCLFMMEDGFHLFIPTERQVNQSLISGLRNPLVSHAFVSRGWRFGNVGYEIIFFDSTNHPYRIEISEILTIGSFLEIPIKSKSLSFSAWSEACKRTITLPAFFQRVNELPLRRGGTIQVAQHRHDSFPGQFLKNYS